MWNILILYPEISLAFKREDQTLIPWFSINDYIIEGLKKKKQILGIFLDPRLLIMLTMMSFLIYGKHIVYRGHTLSWLCDLYGRLHCVKVAEKFLVRFN